MRWYATSEIIDLPDMRAGSRLIVLSEPVETVLRALLVRPADDLTQWQTDPTVLNLKRLHTLTWVGELRSATIPARVPSGHWGLRFDHNPDEQLGEVRVEQQLNYFNDTLLEHLIKQNTGTLLWLSTNPSAVTGATGEFFAHWAAAPVDGVLPTVMAQGASVSDPVAVKFLFEHTGYDCLTQKLAGTQANERGLAVTVPTLDLVTLRQELADLYPAQPSETPAA